MAVPCLFSVSKGNRDRSGFADFVNTRRKRGERDLGRDSLRVFCKALRPFQGPGVQRAIAPIW